MADKSTSAKASPFASIVAEAMVDRKAMGDRSVDKQVFSNYESPTFASTVAEAMVDRKTSAGKRVTNHGS